MLEVCTDSANQLIINFTSLIISASYQCTGNSTVIHLATMLSGIGTPICLLFDTECYIQIFLDNVLIYPYNFFTKWQTYRLDVFEEYSKYTHVHRWRYLCFEEEYFIDTALFHPPHPSEHMCDDCTTNMFLPSYLIKY